MLLTAAAEAVTAVAAALRCLPVFRYQTSSERAADVAKAAAALVGVRPPPPCQFVPKSLVQL